MKSRIAKAAGLALLVLGGLKLNDSFARDRAEMYGNQRANTSVVSAYEEASQGLLGDTVGLGAIWGGAYLMQRRRE